MVDVVSIGNVINDFSVGSIEDCPELGEIRFVDRIHSVIGGSALSMAFGLNSMGVNVKVLSKIGNDSNGDFLLKEMKSNNMDISGIKRVSNVQTAITLALVNAVGDRRFIYCPGTNGDMKEDDYDLSGYSAPTIFCVDGIELLFKMRGEPISHVLKKAKGRGLTTVLDTVYDPLDEWLPAIEKALPFIDVLITSITEAKFLVRTEDPMKIVKFFINSGISNIILKLGEEGCLAYNNGEYFKLGIPRVNVIDTIGAGDNFVAGYITGMVKKFSGVDCARLAVAAGSLSTEYYGGKAYYDFNQVWELAQTLKDVNRV